MQIKKAASQDIQTDMSEGVMFGVFAETPVNKAKLTAMSSNLTEYQKQLSLQDESFMGKQSTQDSNFSQEQKMTHVLNFKDFKGFKKITNIKDRYKIGRVLGEGSFGQVRIAMHRQAQIKCAVKIIKKDKIHAH